MSLLGIDEAGRGPVLGPLVIAGVLISEKDEQKLKDLGVKDSKLLSQEKREYMFDKIIELSKSTRILIIEPEEIDQAVFSKENMNLNWLEAKKSAEIINEFEPTKVILDCPHTIPEKYKDYVLNLLKNENIEILSEHKADMNFPVCSAASILAKVVREKEMDKIKFKYGKTGSGYPADPITQKFIKEYFEKHSEIFRKSWKTFQNLVKNKSQKKIKDF
jgi:ribonuclease HII